jgi:ABC-2 type transport system permease protein
MNKPLLPMDAPVYRRVSPMRIGAMLLRYLYLLRSSWPRIAELVYWPLVQMLMWGFLQTYLNEHSGMMARAGGTLIGAVLLWDVLVRGQLGFSVSFLEEMWSRNLANILISPLRPGEFLIALMAMSVIRLILGMVPVTILAILFFGFNLWGLGLGLAAFFANLLLTAWALGTVVSGLILRNGMGAEGLAWTLMFLIMPISAVFYPVAVLPGFLQPIAWALPPTYVFEGMRAILIDHQFRVDLMVEALVINTGLIIVAGYAFMRLLDSARNVGSLLAVGD